ncbi:MAG TPA: DUF4235 domain-containing protein [Mycobacteriales bacterium]|jgi:hypothetical protein|nr:DUF4235 domain-containing protein [Mycobacteriales bacterium]
MSKAANLAYKPVGIAGKMVAGGLAGALVSRIWQMGHREDPALPGARSLQHGWRDVLLAAALQGTVFAVVKTAVDRAAAGQFARWSGAYPEQ